MTDDTTIDNNNNNVKQFTLNLVTPDQKGSDELRECLDKGIEVFTELAKSDNIQSFFIIILDDTELPTFVGAGEAQTLRTLGALEMASNELLAGLE